MNKVVRIYELKSPAQEEDSQRYWRGRSAEERLSAVEILRRQYGKLSGGEGSDGARDFEEFFASLNIHEFRYLIVGGYAFALHAHPRYTGDMDFFVEASEENARRIIAALKECGFPLSGLSSSDFTVGGRVVHLGHVPLRIVVMTASDGLAFETAWERKVAGASGDQPVHFISREDLIANKKASARKEDLPDLESLI